MNTSFPRSGTTDSIGTSSTVPVRTSRNLYRLIAIATTLSMLLGGLAFLPSEARAAPTEALDDLNLRAEPALNADILDVITTGSFADITGDPVNGFYPVVYNGQFGWAYGFYTTTGSTGGGSVNTGGDQSEVFVSGGPVNFRTGPSEADSVISIIPDGALVALTGDSANGYLSIIYTDQSGWAWEASVYGTGEFVPEAPAEPDVPAAPSEPVATESSALPSEPINTDTVSVGDTVTASGTVVDGALNLRSGPGLDFSIVDVMPDNASLELRGDAQSGFYPVSFAGVTGWAFAEFVQIGSAEPSVPAVPAVPTQEPSAPSEPSQPTAPTPTPTEAPAAPVAPTPTPAEAPAAPNEPSAPDVDGTDGYSEQEIINIIYAAADRYGQPREDMLRVARCESVLDPNAVNSASNASGLFQFLPSTWASTPYADQNIFDPVASANAAGWMWEVGRRNEWVCQ